MPEREAEPSVQQHTLQKVASQSASQLPLSVLLSHVLVAFTIELDNEFEHRMPHWTTRQGKDLDSRKGPWLGSLVMWANCMQYVSPEGITVGQLRQLARTETNLDGMRRWGYLTIEADSTRGRGKQPRSDALLRPTQAGQRAQTIWRPLFGEIEQRWRKRFGAEEIEQLRVALRAVVDQLDEELPACLPILGYGLLSRDRRPGAQTRRRPTESASISSDETVQLPLSGLFSRVLLAFALEFEYELDFSLAICANVVRLIDEHGARVRDLPYLSGVSKEAMNMALGVLQKQHLATVDSDPHNSRYKVIYLTSQGQKLQHASLQLPGLLEQRWRDRFGSSILQALRTSLERLVGSSILQQSPLFQGLQPYPDGWRASVPTPVTLPYYPMVLHRGGFPDGS